MLGINIFGIERKKLAKGVLPEIEVLERMISYFGPVPLGLLQHVNDEDWCLAMMQLNSGFNKDNPAKLFSLWNEQGFPNLDSNFKKFVGKMTDLDPAKRATVDELLGNPWWHD